MRVVFILPGTEGRPKILNGYTIRYGGAQASGTDQSVIVVAEFLAEQGHDVTVVLEKTDKQTVNKVKYTDFSYDGLTGCDVDVLITMLWFCEYDKIPFNVKKGLIYWYHMAWVYANEEIINYCLKHNLMLGLVNISNWAKEQNDWNIKIFQNRLNVYSTIIPNPVMVDLLEEIVKEEKIQKIDRSTIFHAQFSRGGTISDEVVDKLGWEKTYKVDYVDTLNGVDKKTLFKKLLSTDYFIFPLYHPNGCVYKDTFSCCVAEAVAAGVIVVTYPLGAIPEYFSNGCVFAEYPYGSDLEKLRTEKVTCDAQYLNNSEVFINEIIKLEENTALKDEIRRKSKNLCSSNFDIKILGAKWINLLDKIYYNYAQSF